MGGPVRFVVSVLWFAIALGTLGTLRDCTRAMMGHAVVANRHQLFLKDWNRKLFGHPEKTTSKERIDDSDKK